jgi:error-prone DNA polymerase
LILANFVIWPSLYERQRRIILAAGMFAVQGRIQREGEVVHLVARHPTCRRNWPASESATTGFRCRTDAATNSIIGSPGIDPRSLPPKGLRTRDIYIPDLHIDTIKVKTRDFR